MFFRITEGLISRNVNLRGKMKYEFGIWWKQNREDTETLLNLHNTPVVTNNDLDTLEKLQIITSILDADETDIDAIIAFLDKKYSTE